MRIGARIWLVVGFILIAAGHATPGIASDGVLEISPACVETTGCFPGDAPGFPVTIDGSAGRSYRLVGQLLVPDVETTAILISTHDVTIDLGGFRIVRAGCTGSICAPTTGTGSGVGVDVTTRRGIRVANGTIVGMGRYGIALGPDAEVHDVHVRSSGSLGVWVEAGSIVRHVRSYGNGGDGIFANRGSVVSESVAALNDDSGIFVQSGSRVVHNASWRNGRQGIQANSLGSAIEENLVRQNLTDPLASLNVPGINANAGTIARNVVFTDRLGNTAISAVSGTLVDSNVVWNTTGTSLVSFSSDSAYRGNVFGTMSSVPSGVNLGGNSCRTAVCP